MNRRNFFWSGSLATTALAANIASGETQIPAHKIVGIGPPQRLSSWSVAIQAAWGDNVLFQRFFWGEPGQEEMETVLRRGGGGLLILSGDNISLLTDERISQFKHVLLDGAPACDLQSFRNLQQWSTHCRRKLYWLTDWRMDALVLAAAGFQFSRCSVECPSSTMEETLAWSDLAHLLAPKGLPEQVFAAESGQGHMAGVLTWPGQAISWQQQKGLNPGWCKFRKFGA